MKVSTFWNKAFLAALHRLAAADAEAEADEATRRAVSSWQKHANDYVPTMTFRGDLDVAKHPLQLSKLAPPPELPDYLKPVS